MVICPLCSAEAQMISSARDGEVFRVHYDPADLEPYRPVITPCSASGGTLAEAEQLAADRREQETPGMYSRPHP